MASLSDSSAMKDSLTAQISLLLTLGASDQKAMIQSLRVKDKSASSPDDGKDSTYYNTSPMSPGTTASAQGLNSPRSMLMSSNSNSFGSGADSESSGGEDGNITRKKPSSIAFNPHAVPFVPSSPKNLLVAPPGLLQTPPGLAHEDPPVLLSTMPEVPKPPTSMGPLPQHFKCAPMPSMDASMVSARDDVPDSLFAVRLVIGNLLASMPQEGAAIARDILTCIAAQRTGASSVQQTMESMQALQWLKAALENPNALPMPMPPVAASLDMSNYFPTRVGSPTSPAARWEAGKAAQLLSSQPTGYQMWQHQQKQQKMQQQHQHVDGGLPPRRQAPTMPKNARPAAVAAAAAVQASAPTGTLRSHLRELQNVDLRRIFLVRKINRLGFEATSILKRHYSQYGAVERVLVAHSHVKSLTNAGATRLRPSGLGFVVMQREQDATMVLGLGDDQAVQGVMIRCHPFAHRRDEDGFDEDE